MKTKGIVRLNKKNIGVKASIALYTVKYFLDRSSIPGFSDTMFSNILLFLSIVPLMLFIAGNMLTNASLLKKRNSIKNAISVLAAVVVSILIFRIIPYVIYVYTLMLIVAARYIDSSVIIQTVKRSMIAMLLIIAFFSLIGLIPNVSTVVGRYNLGFESRMYGWYILNYCAIEIYYRNRNRAYTYIWLVLLNIIVYCFTKTRLSLYLFAILIVVSVFEDYGKKIGKDIQKKLSLSFVIMFFVSLFLTINYVRFPYFEDMFSGRLRFGMRVISSYGIKLWPRNIEYYTQQFEDGSFTMYVDSGYIDLLVRFGIILTIVVILVYTLLMKKSVKTNNYRWFIWLLIIALFNLINNSFFNVYFDCTVFFIWDVKRELGNGKANYFKIQGDRFDEFK